MKPIHLLAIVPGLSPSIDILILDPLVRLPFLIDMRIKFRLEKFVRRSDIEWADLIVFCRNTEPKYKWIVNEIGEKRIPFIYVIDDNFFEIDKKTIAGQYHRAIERLSQHIFYLSKANLVYVYSPTLETTVQKYSKKVKLQFAPVNLEVIPLEKPKKKSGKIKIVYTTSRYNDDMLSAILVDDLCRLIDDFKEEIEIHFWGAIPKKLRKKTGIVFHPYRPGYLSYMRSFCSEAYDIGLAPLLHDNFHRSKTNNKFREFGACWIAGVYSDVETYTNCVADGKTGIIVSNRKGEWYRAVVKLIENEHLLKTIQQNARAEVEKKFSLSTYCDLFLKDINRILNVQGSIPESSIPISVQASDEIKVATRLRSEIIPQFVMAQQMGLMFFFKKIINAIFYYSSYIRILMYIYFINLQAQVQKILILK